MRERDADTSIEVTTAAAGRTDLLAQRAEGSPIPDELASSGLDRDLLTSHFTSAITDDSHDVVLLSAASDLTATHFVHRERGWIINPPEHWRTTWDADLVEWFDQSFVETGLMSAEEYRSATRTVIDRVRATSGAHVVLVGASTLGGDQPVSYAGTGDDHRLRAHRIDAAQIRISMGLGVSVVDVDRVIANEGGADTVLGPMQYSPQAQAAIADELAFVLDDIGFFEKRPLVAQVGQEAQA